MGYLRAELYFSYVVPLKLSEFRHFNRYKVINHHRNTEGDTDGTAKLQIRLFSWYNMCIPYFIYFVF